MGNDAGQETIAPIGVGGARPASNPRSFTPATAAFDAASGSKPPVRIVLTKVPSLCKREHLLAGMHDIILQAHQGPETMAPAHCARRLATYANP